MRSVDELDAEMAAIQELAESAGHALRVALLNADRAMQSAARAGDVMAIVDQYRVLGDAHEAYTVAVRDIERRMMAAAKESMED